MSTTRVVGFVLLAVIGLTVAPVSGAAVVPATPDQMGDTDAQTDAVWNLAAENETSNAEASVSESDGESSENSNSSANTTVADFMQSTAADAEHTVDNGLFEVTYETADNESKSRLVNERAASFDNRLAQLEAEREELRDQKDDLSSAAYQARLTRLTVEIASLNDSIERTKPKGVAVGHDPTRFEILQENASSLTGPEVATTARGLPGFEDHPGVGGGPPAHAGPDSADGQQGTDSSSGNQGAGAGSGPDPDQDQRPGQGPDRGQGQDQNQGNGANETPTAASDHPDQRVGHGNGQDDTHTNGSDQNTSQGSETASDQSDDSPGSQPGSGGDTTGSGDDSSNENAAPESNGVSPAEPTERNQSSASDQTESEPGPSN
ncbi:hypothetical protein C482_00430 [Natrialba chahannaoensis JCM 10990]|uniref:Uncharacterized protein n=1 Tax=Natrialba chahannaoensis JCM 10990 TaxID=1227492 RepID=M0B6U3_9EURY|nr:hypothetical protein [Natrialba chahannaoensis]ELZ06242.1 hypothetical protein C482_00430 [Natrialba chahannaoensis JCM 10990]